MIRLDQTFGAHAGRILELERDVIRFGRLPDNDVVFDAHADIDASGRHAEIRREGELWILVDVGSRNGTFVAGRAITRHVLRSGDEVEFGLGGPRMRITLQAQVRADAATAAATPVGPLPAPSRAPTAAPSPPSPSAPANAPESEKRYGHRTVGMMIQAAVEQAQRQPSGTRGTAFFRAIATETAQRSSRGLKVAVAGLALLVLFTLAAVVGLFVYSRWQEQALRAENVRLQRRLLELNESESAERARVEERLEGLNDDLAEEHRATSARIAETNERAIHAVLAVHEDRRAILCTAFAVRPDILATSAGCVGAVERAIGGGRDVQIVTPSDSPRRVQQMWHHPSYVAGQPSPDVGLIRVDRPTLQQARLATPTEAAALQAGAPLFLYAFPRQVESDETPEPTLTSGVCGGLAAFDNANVDAARRHLVRHSAAAEDGAPGGPIFDRDGRVIAIDTGRIERDASEVEPSTSTANAAEPSGGRAVRVDLLLQLLAGLSP